MKANICLFLSLCGVFSSLANAQETDQTAPPDPVTIQPASVSTEDDQEFIELPWMHNDPAVSPATNEARNNATVDVDKYTGALQVQIPLYEMKTNGGTLPITLNYRGTGIRLDDVHNAIGLGWDLSAGGRITRIV